MSIFPFISNYEGINLKQNKVFPLYKEVAWDFDKDFPILENGTFKIVEGNEAIKVWVYKAILAQRYNHSIYSWDYGSEVKELIGKNYTKALVEAEAKRLIEECLLINPYILSVDVTSTSFKDSTLTCDIKITTIYGDMEVNI